MKFELDKNCKDICDRIEKISNVSAKLIKKHEIETFVTNIRRLEAFKVKIININENILDVSLLSARAKKQFED